MRVRSWSHVGITVSDFNKAVDFYWDVFGCALVGVADSAEERVRGFFGVERPGATCKIGWIRVPGGGVIEIFHFTPPLPPSELAWSRIGLTHLCLNVRGIDRWYEYLRGKGVEIVEPPTRSSRGHRFFFVKDFDGNLIEITDLGYMYHVLAWLGPLGGWLFRRGRYAQYYGTSWKG
jgi:catechol 2,3-dioxygenase-like lactoylglutathione lyase family enzyme